MKKTRLVLVISLIMVLCGSILSSGVQSGFGAISVKDISFETDGGAVLAGQLLVPKNVNAENPAPAVVTTHGYLNSHGMQTNFSIEFARRGYVVFNIDMFGHGNSGTERPDYEAVIPAVKYLSGLDFVDSDNIGLEGHSKGGFASTIAAASLPQGSVKSVLAVGSGLAWPMMAGIEWGSDTPINYGTIFGKYDEFGWLFWPANEDMNANKSSMGTYSPIMMGAFGTDEPVVPMQWYGDAEGNNLRIMYSLDQTHTQNHLSSKSAAYAMNFMNATLDGGNTAGLADNDMIWFWKEIGTTTAMLGAFLFLFAFGTWLLGIGQNSTYMLQPAEGRATTKSARFWIMLIIGSAIPALTYYPFMGLGEGKMVNRVFPQSASSATAVWAGLNGLIALVLLLVMYFAVDKKQGAGTGEWGYRTSGKNILRQIMLGLCTALAGYALLCLTGFFFKTDFRFYVVGFMPLTLPKFQTMCTYLIFFIVYALCNSLALNASYRFSKGSYAKTAVFSVIANVAGMLVLLAIGYIGIYASGGMTPFGNMGWSLRVIQIISFTITLPMAGLLNTWFFKKTGTIYMGSTITALFLAFATVGNTCFDVVF